MKTRTDINDSNIFSDPPLRVMTVKTIISKWDLIKLKRKPSTEQKDNPQNGRKSLQVNPLTRDSAPKFRNTFFSSIPKKQTTPSKNGQKI